VWRFPVLLLLASLAACGGGGGDEPALPAGGRDDPTVYSSQPGASLPGAEEAAAVTAQRLVLDGRELAYTATAGHLIARDPVAGAAQASLFYVAYTLDGSEAATRPVTFFYNGGPGSASVWLHLGSFGPKRLVTGVPATTAARPFPLVDNNDSLLNTSDLVFLNAVGSGRSQAIAPFRNQDFWGVDVDAALFRDAITRWLDLNGRRASPLFLYGESYGGPRTAVLARRLQEAGVPPAGLVLQSPALDYNSNCGVTATPGVSCAAYLPSYAATGAWFGRTLPVPDTSDTGSDAWVAAAQAATDTTYAPALQAWLDQGLAAPTLWQPLADLTGLAATSWQRNFNLGPTPYREQLLPGQLLGRYDARMAAPVGSALAAEGDPSSTWLTSSFQSAINSYLRDTLGYRNSSTYVLLSNAIQSWDFSHAGRALPDTVPDLAAALAADPALRVLAVSGRHDLATPFHLTQTDLARLGSPRVTALHYPGGHMSFLDDGTRPRQRADVAAFITAAVAGRPQRRVPLAARPPAAPDRAGAPAAAGGLPLNEPALQAPMRDPWVPPR
jgi:carboxypeptidase C (cathepsin A)